MKRRSAKLLLAGIFLASFLVGNAYAELAMVGKVGANGFPTFYKDLGGARGTSLRLCLNRALCVFDPPIPGNAWSRQVGFGLEAPYFEAHSSFKTSAGVDADLQLKLRATYGNTVANGNQIVENTLIIRVKGLPANGRYTVVHPYGKNTFAVRGGKIDFNQTVKGANFSAALGGPVGPFLKAVRPKPPAGFIGNPNRRQSVTGSPLKTNYFQITGPATADLGGSATTPNVVRQNLFRLQGRLK